jgi:purine catabolism regulator
VQGSKPEIVLKQVAKLSGFAVVLANQSRQILAFDPAERTAEDVITEWAEHSHRPHKAARTLYDPLSGWLQTTVGARGNDWGRLVLMAPSAGARDLDAALDPTMTVHHSLVMLVEQAAWTLAIGRLVDRESQLLDLTTHSNVLSKLLAGGHDDELDQQSEALGVPFRRTQLAGLAFCARGAAERNPRDRQRGLRALASAISDIARDARVSSLVAPVDDFTVGMLTTIPRGSSDLEMARTIAQQLEATGMTVIASSGGYGQGIEASRTILLEAIETVGTALSMSVESNVVTAADLGVRGLIHTLRDDPRVIAFSERTIGPLVAYDAANHTTLVSLLRHFLDAGRNKTVAAKRAFVSRPWMHERLRLIGGVLGVELENESDCVNLQVALLVMDAQRDRATTHQKIAP